MHYSLILISHRVLDLSSFLCLLSSPIPIVTSVSIPSHLITEVCVDFSSDFQLVSLISVCNTNAWKSIKHIISIPCVSTNWTHEPSVTFTTIIYRIQSNSPNHPNLNIRISQMIATANQKQSSKWRLPNDWSRHTCVRDPQLHPSMLTLTFSRLLIFVLF